MKTQYEVLHAQLLNACDQMLSILGKADSAIESSKVTEEKLLSSSIVEGMFTFTKQVQVFTDLMQGSICRLSGVTKPIVSDDDKTLSDLIARVEMTKEYIKTCDIKNINGEGKRIHLGWMPENMYFDGDDFAEKYVLQNVFFHLVTTYNILRMNNGEIGKMDFLTNIQMRQDK